MRSLVRRIQNRGYATMGRIAEHLDRLSAGDESNAAIDAVEAVNLMTVHAAKGLEFPIVFVVNIERGTGGRIDPVLVTERWAAQAARRVGRRDAGRGARGRATARPGGNQAPVIRGRHAGARSALPGRLAQGREAARGSRQPGGTAAGIPQADDCPGSRARGRGSGGMDGGGRPNSRDPHPGAARRNRRLRPVDQARPRQLSWPTISRQSARPARSTGRA